MIRIAIVDDEKYYLEKEQVITDEYFRKKGLVFQIETFQDAKWFLSGMQEEQFDIYILDVEMPKKTGLELAKELRKLYPDPILIFVTNFVDYAIEAYEVNTYRYIPKEVLKEKLTAAYDALLPSLLEKEEMYYVIEKKMNIEKISYSDILYLKKSGRYTVLTHNRGESRVRKSLIEVYEKLDGPEFMFIDKSCVVNLRHVMRLQEHEIQMRDGMKLTVGRTRISQVKDAIADYWR